MVAATKLSGSYPSSPGPEGVVRRADHSARTCRDAYQCLHRTPEKVGHLALHEHIGVGIVGRHQIPHLKTLNGHAVHECSGWKALVNDHQRELVLVETVASALMLQGLHRGDHDAAVMLVALGLDDADVLFGPDVAELLNRLLHQLVAVDEHENAAVSLLRESRSQNRLARARRQNHELPPHSPAGLGHNGFDGLLLVVAERQHAHPPS
jgi:NAD-dependent DNA ligase